MKYLSTFKLFEGKAFKATKVPFEKDAWDEDKKEAFRTKVEELVKSFKCKAKQVGNDFEVSCDGKHIIQVMFRNNYVGVKKTSDKFPKEFKYTELGKIKAEIGEIIKSCK